jgi:hypothetical protein
MAHGEVQGAPNALEMSCSREAAVCSISWLGDLPNCVGPSGHSFDLDV